MKMRVNLYKYNDYAPNAGTYETMNMTTGVWGIVVIVIGSLSSSFMSS